MPAELRVIGTSVCDERFRRKRQGQQLRGLRQNQYGVARVNAGLF